MRSHRRLLAVIASFALIGAACGGDDSSDTTPATDAVPETTEAPATTEADDTDDADTDTDDADTDTEGTEPEEEDEEFVPPARGDADLVIWADDTRAPVLTPIAAAFSEDEGVNVVVLEVPFDQIRDSLTLTGPAGEGPDIIIGAHDWLGDLVSDGVVAPLDLGASADLYSESAVAAFAYDGQQYGLPYAVENIALIRNTDLVPEAPATFEELTEIALALRDDGTVSVPLAVQQGPADPYHNYPLFTGAGGYLFGQTEDGSYIAEDLGLDSPGSLAAAAAFAEWHESGLINKDVDYGVMISSFSSGDAPFAITGPWAVGDFADVNFVVEPIPPIDGNTPNVFVGVQGFMVSAFSDNPELATTFVLDYLNDEAVMLELFEAGGRPPAMLSAFEVVSDDPVVEGFGLAGQSGAPLPAIPAMRSVWGSWTDAYNLIFTGSNPEQAFNDAAASIRTAIEG